MTIVGFAVLVDRSPSVNEPIELPEGTRDRKQPFDAKSWYVPEWGETKFLHISC